MEFAIWGESALPQRRPLRAAASIQWAGLRQPGAAGSRNRASTPHVRWAARFFSPCARRRTPSESGWKDSRPEAFASARACIRRLLRIVHRRSAVMRFGAAVIV